MYYQAVLSVQPLNTHTHTQTHAQSWDYYNFCTQIAANGDYENTSATISNFFKKHIFGKFEQKMYTNKQQLSPPSSGYTWRIDH